MIQNGWKIKHMAVVISSWEVQGHETWQQDRQRGDGTIPNGCKLDSLDMEKDVSVDIDD